MLSISRGMSAFGSLPQLMSALLLAGIDQEVGLASKGDEGPGTPAQVVTEVGLPTALASQKGTWTEIDIHSVFHRATGWYSQPYPQGGGLFALPSI
jgi:hypothetical protein